jgi:L-galactono-1,4-lactone dehydrogenase
VSDLLKELSKHGLTLENFSSIQEQQLGGWTQVAAHGTGITLSTVEEQVGVG